jgi:membrane fusion protein, multidrug efflux system
MKRKLIVTGVALLIMVLGSVISGKLGEGKKMPQKPPGKQTALAFAREVVNTDLKPEIRATGSLMANHRTEIFAEVQGVMQPDHGRFRAGNTFGKGEVLLAVQSDDFRAALVAERSAFQSSLAGLLPDLKTDFPESFEVWNRYVRDFNPRAGVAELPEPRSDKEKLFLTGRNVFSGYFNLKNRELTLAKYSIEAPFSGVLTEALVTPGTVVRPGQKLGEFIDPAWFEMEVSVSASLAANLSRGAKVAVSPADGSGRLIEGEVVRINRKVDVLTRTVSVFVLIPGAGLEEGLFAEVVLDGDVFANAFEINRSVMHEPGIVYVVRDSLLLERAVEPLFYRDQTVIVRGLKDGDQVLERPLAGAYPGMVVKVYQAK